MKKGESKKGFTVIEVVLVLAIAGLIFVMVFVALPALQRSARDNARRDDMMKFVSEVKRYQTNNRGALPGSGEEISGGSIGVTWGEDGSALSEKKTNTWGGFYRDYLGKNFIDPDGEHYQLTVVKCDASTDVKCNNSFIDTLKDSSFPYSASFDSGYTILVILQAKCSGTDVVGSSNPRNLAVLYRMEGSDAYCFNT